MPQPPLQDVHVDAALTNISIAFMQSAEGYVADKVFPPVSVNHKTDKFHVWDRNDFLRDEVEKRAPATESAGGGADLTQDTYSCDVWAYHMDLDDQTRANADAAVNLESASTRFITQKFLIRRERQFVTDYFGTGIWTTNVVGVTDFTQWDDGASDPELDIQVGVKTILKSTGFKPNRMVVGFAVHQALKRHPLIKDRFKYTSSDSITTAMLAAFFEIERYIVAEAIFATNEEDAATDVYDFALGDNCLLAYANPSPGLMEPSAGYNFIWNGFTGLNDLGTRVKNFRMENLEADRIEGSFAFDMKVVSADLGYFFSAAVSG